MVAAHLSDRGCEHDEQVIAFGIALQRIAHAWLGEDRLRIMTAQQGVQLALDGRAQQQWKARVIDAEVQAYAFCRTLGVQCLGQLDQRIDVGQAHQAEAHAPAIACGAVMPLMQFVHPGRKLPGQLGANSPTLAAAAGDGHDACATAYRLFAQGCQPRVDEGAVLPGKTLAVDVIRRPASELVEPGAADIRRAARLAAMLAIGPTSGAIGLEQPTHQRGRQGRGGQQHAAAEQTGPMHQASQRG